MGGLVLYKAKHYKRRLHGNCLKRTALHKFKDTQEELYYILENKVEVGDFPVFTFNKLVISTGKG